MGAQLLLSNASVNEQARHRTLDIRHSYHRGTNLPHTREHTRASQDYGGIMQIVSFHWYSGRAMYIPPIPWRGLLNPCFCCISLVHDWNTQSNLSESQNAAFLALPKRHAMILSWASHCSWTLTSGAACYKGKKDIRCGLWVLVEWD